MVIPGKVLDCIDRHGNVHPTFAVVPLEIDAAVEIASPIHNNFVRISAYCRKEVLEILVADVFDTKVVSAQIKPDRLGYMFPKTGGVLYFEVAMSSQV
jgi:hypothetical protein